MSSFETKLFAEIDAELFELRARAEAYPYISIQEIAGLYNISIRTLRREQAAGQMPPRIKRSRQLVYLKQDIEEWFRLRGQDGRA